MTSATISALYSELFAGNKLTVSLADEKEFNNLRVSLVKAHKLSVDLDLSTDSVCADWDNVNNKGTYWLGTPRKRVRKQFTFEIVPNDDGQSPDSN